MSFALVHADATRTYEGVFCVVHERGARLPGVVRDLWTPNQLCDRGDLGEVGGTVVVPNCNPGKLLVAQEQVLVGAVGGVAFAVVVAIGCEIFAIAQKEPEESLQGDEFFVG